MANNFQRGDLLPVQFQLAGGTLTTLNIKGYTFDDSCLLFDVTHTGLQGVGTGRIAGKGDASGNVTADYDADASPYLTRPGIVKGATGLMLFFFTPNRAAQQPVIIEKVHWESATESELKYNFDWKQNVLVGMPVYPAF